MEVLVKLFSRDLSKLKHEIELFEHEKNLWKVKGAITNSAGNLCLHLIGNLNHFIGAIIGETNYARDRYAEFNDKNTSRVALCQMIDDTKSVMTSSLLSMDRNKLTDTYPIKVFEEEMTYEFFIIHLVSHLSYHLGQINYLRRILES